MATGATKAADVFVPEVATEVATAEFPNQLALGMAGSPFVRPFPPSAVLTPGGTVKFPRWSPLGDFDDLTEDVAMVPEKMASDATDTTTVLTGGKAVEITDWADLAASSSPSQEAGRQIAQLAARYADAKLVDAAAGTTLVHDITADTTKTIGWNSFVDAIVGKWGDKAFQQVGGIVIHSKQMGDLMKDDTFTKASNVGNDAAPIRGFVGRLGLYPVYVSDRVPITADAGGAGIPGYTALILKAGALGFKFQRTLLVETDRDILKKSDVLAADVRFATKLLYGVPLPAIAFKTL